MNTNGHLKVNNSIYVGGGRPLISIIIPAYNASEFIEEALETIFRQSIKHDLLEVLVINDGSTDDTEEKANKFKDKRNLHIINIANGGAGHARNVGINNAKGEFIIFLDADDLLLPNSLNTIVSLLKERNENEIDIIYTPKYFSNMSLHNDISICYPENISEISHHMPEMEFWTCIYRRNYLINHKVYFFEYKEQDIETAFRYRAFSRTDKIITEREVGFYLHRDNLCSNIHTWKPITMNYVKAKVYSELVSELEGELIKQDSGYLKYIEYNCLYDFFDNIRRYGFDQSQREQVYNMCDQIRQFKLSISEWLTLSGRKRVRYLKRKVKMHDIDFIMKYEKKEKIEYPKKEQVEKQDGRVLERWENLKIK